MTLTISLACAIASMIFDWVSEPSISIRPRPRVTFHSLSVTETRREKMTRLSTNLMICSGGQYAKREPQLLYDDHGQSRSCVFGLGMGG